MSESGEVRDERKEWEAEKERKHNMNERLVAKKQKDSKFTD